MQLGRNYQILGLNYFFLTFDLAYDLYSIL
jgi:hypothetical protein